MMVYVLYINFSVLMKSSNCPTLLARSRGSTRKAAFPLRADEGVTGALGPLVGE